MDSNDPYAYDIKARQGSRNFFELLDLVQRLAMIAENQLDSERDTNLVHEQEIKKLKARLRQDDLGTEYLRAENRTLREEKERLEKNIRGAVLSLADAYRIEKDHPGHLPGVVQRVVGDLESITDTPEAPF